MKERVFALDRIIEEIIQSHPFSSFTITQLRLEYMRCLPRQSSPSPAEVRRYIYKQVGRLVRLGWVSRDGEPMSRNVQYQVKEIPKGITLNLIEPKIGQEPPSKPELDALSTNLNSPPAPVTSSLNDIEARLNKVRMDFIATLGEAETYKAIVAEHPYLREELEGRYILSRDQSSNLMGQLRALEQTVKILEKHQ